MTANVEFQEEAPGGISVASSAARRRVFLDQTDGFFKTKDSAGVIRPISSIALPFIHNAAVTLAGSPYAASIQETVKVNVDTGAIIVNLPTAVGNAGHQVKVVSLSDALVPNVCTIVPFGAQTINGDPNRTLTAPREFSLVESDGANWLAVG